MGLFILGLGAFVICWLSECDKEQRDTIVKHTYIE